MKKIHIYTWDPSKVTTKSTSKYRFRTALSFGASSLFDICPTYRSVSTHYCQTGNAALTKDFYAIAADLGAAAKKLAKESERSVA